MGVPFIFVKKAVSNGQSVSFASSVVRPLFHRAPEHQFAAQQLVDLEDEGQSHGVYHHVVNGRGFLRPRDRDPDALYT